MGQFWQVFNVDRREKDLVDYGKLSEFFFTDLSDLYEALHIPCLPREVDKWLSPGTFSIQPKPIGALSTEILDMIFEAILDDTTRYPTRRFFTCIKLFLTCKRLLTVGKRHILRSLISRYARAADCRVVCLGEYAGKDDQAPPGMLSDAEIKELETTSMPYERGEPTEEDLRQRCLYTFACELYKSHHRAKANEYHPIQLLLGLIARKRAEWSKNPARNAARLHDLDRLAVLAGMGHYSAPAYPAGPNVMCNLAKGECVREDALVVLESQWCRVTLAHALLSRICYSPDPSAMACSEAYEARLAKGPWAGDRFRITSAAEMPPLAGGREWTDVTEDVNEMLLHLWRQNESSTDEEEGGVGWISESESESSQASSP